MTDQPREEHPNAAATPAPAPTPNAPIDPLAQPVNPHPQSTDSRPEPPANGEPDAYFLPVTEGERWGDTRWVAATTPTPSDQQPVNAQPAGPQPTTWWAPPPSYGPAAGSHPYQPAAYGPYGPTPPYGPGGGFVPPGYVPGSYVVPPQPNPKRHRNIVLGSIASGVAALLVVGGVAVAVQHTNSGSGQQTSAQTPAQSGTNPFGSGTGSGSDGSGSSGGTNTWPFGGADGGSGSGSGSTGSTGTTGEANATQSVGVVDINTVLDFGTGKAAGTGIVLTSSGEILTNNHVVQDSTSITVRVVSTNKTYTATVVGTDATDDIAVLQLKDASGLATAKIGDSSTVSVGQAVTAVGNAGGDGGTPSSATGSVTALDQSITASDENGSNAERLTGMIQINAAIQAGDSGGPLYSSSGSIIGINTAASSSRASTQTVGFAIPINKALSIAQQVEAGKDTATIKIGYPAFLGVELASTGSTGTSGATISGVLQNGAAAKAGLVAGDTITKVNGKTVTDATALSTIMASLDPGQQVSVSWTDANGASHTATVTLGTGPVG